MRGRTSTTTGFSISFRELILRRLYVGFASCSPVCERRINKVGPRHLILVPALDGSDLAVKFIRYEFLCRPLVRVLLVQPPDRVTEQGHARYLARPPATCRSAERSQGLGGNILLGHDRCTRAAKRVVGDVAAVGRAHPCGQH